MNKNMKNIIFENKVAKKYILCDDENNLFDNGVSKSDIWKFDFKNSNFHFFVYMANHTKETYHIDFANIDFITESLKDIHKVNLVKLKIDFMDKNNENIISLSSMYNLQCVDDYYSIEVVDSKLLDKLQIVYKVIITIELSE